MTTEDHVIEVWAVPEGGDLEPEARSFYRRVRLKYDQAPEELVEVKSVPADVGLDWLDEAVEDGVVSAETASRVELELAGGGGHLLVAVVGELAERW